MHLNERVALMSAVEVEPVSRSVDTDRLFIRNQTTRSSMNSVPEGFLAALRICRRNEAQNLLLPSPPVTSLRCAPCESIQSLRSTRNNSLALLASSLSALSPTHSSRHFRKSFRTSSQVAGGSPPTRNLPQNWCNVRLATIDEDKVSVPFTLYRLMI